MIGQDQQWLGASFDFQIQTRLGKGGFSNVFAAKLMGPHTVQQWMPFFSNGSSAAAGRSLTNTILAKLPIGTSVALKTGIPFDQLNTADAMGYGRQDWEKLQLKNFQIESEVFQLTAGSPVVLECFGLCKVQLLTAAASQHSDSWPQGLLLERSEQTVEDFLGSIPADPQTTHWIVTSAAKIIMALHRLGAIYRDLKTSNLHLCRQRDNTLVIKAADFGLSYIIRHPGDYAHSIVGTKVVMAPEAKYGLNCDVSLDTYSLGEYRTEEQLFTNKSVTSQHGSQPTVVRSAHCMLLLLHFVLPAAVTATDRIP